jgi:aryl-alcohol dehydrogenase-like predicted oxidoreductase
MERDLQGRLKKRAQQHFSDRAYDLLAIIEDLAAEKECTPSQVALAWLLQQPGVTSVIIGPRTISHLEDNLGATSILIDDNDRQRLEEVAEPELAIVPYYHGSMIDFGSSQYSW